MNYNEEVSKYINSAPAEQKSTMQTLRDILLSIGGITEKIKWAQPVFIKGADLAYMRSNKAHVTLGFFDGAGLSDPEDLLLGSAKNMRFLRLNSPDDINAEAIEAFMQQLIKA